MAAKKAAEQAEKSGAPSQDAPVADERPAAEIVADLMQGMSKPSRGTRPGHRGPYLEIRRREEKPNPVAEWFKRAVNAIRRK